MKKSKPSLQKQIKRQVHRIKKAENERDTIIGQTIYLGTLGLLFTLPLVFGAYIGRWLDSLADGYSMRWTLSLLFLGILIGFANVYLLIRENDNE